MSNNKKQIKVVRRTDRSTQNDQNSRPKKRERVNMNVPIVQSIERDDPGDQLSKIATMGYGKVLASYPSVMNFASVYSDPFSTLSARIPMLPLMPSKLVRFVVTGSSVISNAKTGWVAVFPENMVTTAASVSVNLLTGGPTFFSGVSGTDYFSTATNSPYPYATYDYNNVNGLCMRLVSCGIRVRYQGTTLQSSGDWYAVQTNPRQTVAGLGTTSINKFPGNKTGAFNNGAWHAYTRHITSNQDFNFLSNIFGTGWVDSVSGLVVAQDAVPYMGMIFNGSAGEPFEYEAAVHAELVGPNLDYTGLQNPHVKETEEVVTGFAKKRHKDRTTKDHTVGVPAESKIGKIANIIKETAEQQFPLASNAIKIIGSLYSDK